MKSVWATLGIFGGVCFLTMGLPLMLAVGLVGLLSTSVWLPLLAAVIGIGGLLASKAISGRCQSCAAIPASTGAEPGGSERSPGRYPAESDEDTRGLAGYATARER